jgi:coatomer subunit gamma
VLGCIINEPNVLLQLEDLEISVADQVQKVARTNFGASWEEAGPENELEDIFALSSMQTLDEAVKNIVQFLGMQPCERSDRVPEGKSSHVLLLAGK